MIDINNKPPSKSKNFIFELEEIGETNSLSNPSETIPVINSRKPSEIVPSKKTRTASIMSNNGSEYRYIPNNFKSK